MTVVITVWMESCHNCVNGKLTIVNMAYHYILWGFIFLWKRGKAIKADTLANVTTELVPYPQLSQTSKDKRLIIQRFKIRIVYGKGQSLTSLCISICEFLSLFLLWPATLLFMHLFFCTQYCIFFSIAYSVPDDSLLQIQLQFKTVAAKMRVFNNPTCKETTEHIQFSCFPYI